jgi:hypothetical protein
MRQKKKLESTAGEQATKNDGESDGLPDRIDLLLKVIGRFDFYINSTNTKASLILAWNGIVVGALLLKYDVILAQYKRNWFAWVAAASLLSLIGMFSVVSIGLVFKVVFPFLKSTSKTTEGESILFFDSVASMGAEKYFDKVAHETSEEVLLDLADQAVILAKGAQHKMLTMQKSIRCIYLELLILAALVILLTIVQYA